MPVVASRGSLSVRAYGRGGGVSYAPTSTFAVLGNTNVSSKLFNFPAPTSPSEQISLQNIIKNVFECLKSIFFTFFVGIDNKLEIALFIWLGIF